MNNCNDDKDKLEVHSLVWKFIFFLFLWQSVFHVTERALKCSLLFFKYFVKIFGTTYQNVALVAMSDEFPTSLSKAEKLLGIHDKGVINYVVCIKCHSIYKPENCIIKLHNGKVKSKLCNHIKYPNHPYHSKRQPCNTPMMKEISSMQLRAIRSFPYCPLKISLQRLVLQPEFLSSCEKWRERECIIPDNILGNIYDGLVWKSFRNDFLSSPYCYLLSLNVDWFQPFKRTEYSVGAIYATVQNLPREKRYKEENVVLIGLVQRNLVCQ